MSAPRLDAPADPPAEGSWLADYRKRMAGWSAHFAEEQRAHVAAAYVCAEVRLDAPGAGGGDDGTPGPLDRTCLWCGQAYLSPAPEAEFCGQPCRKAFNNLRAMRGAELYDLFMALRHDRAVATAFKVWRALNRLAAGFRFEDRVERAGRRSWRHPGVILARRPYLAAEEPHVRLTQRHPIPAQKETCP